MDKRFDKLEEKLDRIVTDLADIKIVQAEQAKDLKYHIKRTDISEDRLEQMEEKLLPLVEAKNRIEGVFKLGGIIATVVATLVGSIKVIEYIISIL